MTDHPHTYAAGDTVAPQTLTTVDGAQISLPAPEGLTHLQLRRFAGCPICNLHLRSVVARSAEISAAGITEVVVFHSSADDLRRYQTDLPFAVVGDPERELYRQFGVETAVRAVLTPRMLVTIPRALAAAVFGVIRGKRPAPPVKPEGGSLGLPADVLMDPSGRIVAIKYGTDAYDQWSVDELLEIAGRVHAPELTAAQ